MAIGDTRLDNLWKRRNFLLEVQAWKQSFDKVTKDQILDWVKNDQLKNRGVDGKGEVIGYYSYATELITKGRKRQGDPYTLEDTGAFYASMEVEITDSLLYVTGNGRKGNDNLYTKYGDYITTLTDGNVEKLKEIINQKIIDYVRKVLQVV